MYDVYLLKTYVSPVVASSVEARGTIRPRQESRIQGSNDSELDEVPTAEKKQILGVYVCVYINMFIQCAI